MQRALVIAAHGSHYNPNTAAPAWECVDAIRRTGLFDEVTAAFWKEQPSFGTVLEGLAATDVTVVALFSSAGYFSRQVLPAELTPRAGQRVQITAAVGESAAFAAIVSQRVTRALQAGNLPPDETAVVVVGHGTGRHAGSAGTTEQQVQQVRATRPVGAVFSAYLDQPPYVADVYARTPLPQLVVVPFFVAAGLHTQTDVPQALGISPEPYVAQQRGGRSVIYTPPVGLTHELPGIVLQLAGRPAAAPATGSAWDGFPRLRPGLLGRTAVREVWLGRADAICHVADRETHASRLARLDTPAAVRATVRFTAAGRFRPWATLGDLPQGWYIPTPDHARRAAAVLSIYPHLTRIDETRSVAAVGARQQGKYRPAATLKPEQIGRLVHTVCKRCCLHPAWHTGKRDALACAEPCSWWLEKALDATRKP